MSYYRVDRFLVVVFQEQTPNSWDNSIWVTSEFLFHINEFNQKLVPPAMNLLDYFRLPSSGIPILDQRVRI